MKRENGLLRSSYEEVVRAGAREGSCMHHAEHSKKVPAAYLSLGWRYAIISMEHGAISNMMGVVVSTG